MAGSATLVVGPSWVGDMVMAQSLFMLLRERDPDCAIDVVAPGWSLPVVERMPEVRRGIALDTVHGELGIRKRRQVGRALRAGRYSQAIVMPRSFKAALVPWFARIPRRTGYRGEIRYGLINDLRRYDRSREQPYVSRFLKLGVEPDEPLPRAPYPRLRVSAGRQAELFDSLGLSPSRPAVALMPGAEFGPAKCWPLENFADLARLLASDGFDVWVLGSGRDAPAGESIAAAGHAHNLCGHTSLADAVDLLGHAAHAVSNDSGLMHMAAAVGTRVQAIYGSTSPRYTPPLTDNCVIHFRGLDCSPCFERECPLGHLNCLREITPDAVHSSIRATRRDNVSDTAPKIR